LRGQDLQYQSFLFFIISNRHPNSVIPECLYRESTFNTKRLSSPALNLESVVCNRGLPHPIVLQQTAFLLYLRRLTKNKSNQKRGDYEKQ
jgi:hypothetical protein